MRKYITLVLALVFVLGLAGCSGSAWGWAQGLGPGDIVRVEVWSQDGSWSSKPLTEEETAELIALLNGLTEDDFSENRDLRGGTPTFGLSVETANETFHINESIAPNSTLEIAYGETQWWIDSAELRDFIQEKAAAGPAE